MPIYEYRCSACGHELEALQRFSDAPLTVCPSCHQVALRKLVSAAGFQLKGSGWYATDFRNSGKPAPKDASKSQAGSDGHDAKTDTKSDAKAGTSTEATSESKSESKSEGKTESKSATPATPPTVSSNDK